MSRCALFVDVGYLREALRASGADRHGSAARLDYSALAPVLGDFVAADCGVPLLRSYWYDAAPGRGESLAMRRLATTPRVKVRFGTISGSVQKEVDIHLHDDLTHLAEGGLVPLIYLLSGDGDFRPTVSRAQADGAELVLVEIDGSPAAHTLASEVDRRVALSASDLARGIAAPLGSPSAPADDIAVPTDPYQLTAFQAGGDFARQWLGTADPSEVAALMSRPHWRLPGPVDAELLRATDAATGIVRDQPDLRRHARAGFWRELTTQRQQSDRRQT